MNNDQLISLPNDPEIERMVLGSLIIESDTIYRVYEQLHEGLFYKPEYKIIYQSIKKVYEKGFKIDILTVINQLRKDEQLESVGGITFITELTNHVGCSANIEYHIKILVEKFLKRELIRISESTITDIYQKNDIFDIHEKLVTSITGLINQYSDGFSDLKTISNELYKEIDLIKNGGSVTIKSKFSSINKQTGGYYPEDIIMVGGRPGDGKTLFAVNESLHFASNNIPVLYFNFEMKNRDILKRIISDKANIDHYYIQRCILTEDEQRKMDRTIGEVEKFPFYIYQKSATITEMEMLIKKYIMQLGVKIVIIDHLGLIRITGKDRIEQTRLISNQLKRIAKDNKIPIIILNQLSRNSTSDGKVRKPGLSDLRHTGATEEDADQVFLLFRPENHGIKFMDIDGQESDSTGKALIIIAKNRHGIYKELLMGFDGRYQRFFEFEPDKPEYNNFTEKEPF